MLFVSKKKYENDINKLNIELIKAKEKAEIYQRWHNNSGLKIENLKDSMYGLALKLCSYGGDYEKAGRLIRGYLAYAQIHGYKTNCDELDFKSLKEQVEAD